jgi:hypothetical protein
MIFDWYRSAFPDDHIRSSHTVTFSASDANLQVRESPLRRGVPQDPIKVRKPFQSGQRAKDEMRTSAVRSIRITHRSSGEVIAEGPLGLFGITPFEGNLYIRRKYLRTSHLRPNWVPGLCIYKFLYVWLDLRLPDRTWEPFVGWMYWLPNPLLPFIAFRPAVPRLSPALQVEVISVEATGHRGSLQ